MTNLDKLRESFEDEYIKILAPSDPRVKEAVLSRFSTGEYIKFATEDSWKLYQAAHISAVKQCAEICIGMSDRARTLGEAESFRECEARILALLPKDRQEVNK